MNKDHLALIAHIEALNAKTQAWVDEDPEQRWAGLLTTDLDHWLGYGIETVEQFERYDAETAHWEIYREIHGIKPSWMDYKSMTVEEILEETDRMIKCANEQAAEEERLEAERKEKEEAERKRVEEIKRKAFKTSDGWPVQKFDIPV